jgi:hypothetical protein
VYASITGGGCMPSASLTPSGLRTSPPGVAADRGQTRTRWARRYVALIAVVGVLATCVITYRVARRSGVYLAQVDVLFLAPGGAALPNALMGRSGDLAPVAGAVGKMVDPKSGGSRVVSPSVTLADQGIRQGYSVTLPNDGVQWADRFDRPLLDVQAVGKTASGVDRTVTVLVGEINARLAYLQDRAGVAQVNRIHTKLSPGRVQVYYLAGRRGRAVAASVLVGLLITVMVAVLVRRRLTRWIEDRQARPSAVAPQAVRPLPG